MKSLRDIRVYTRTPDGIVRQAIRFDDRTEWEWVISGADAIKRHGDAILPLPEGVPLPRSEFEYFNTIKMFWEPRK